jgi:small ligand-binding sensory domain FIST
MPAPAASFEVRSASPERVAAAIRQALGQLKTPTALLVFCTGRIASLMTELAADLAASGLRLPTLILSGPGVLSERGEIAGESAVTGLAWSGGKAVLRSVRDVSELETAHLLSLVAERADGTSPALLFIRSEGFRPEHLWHVRSLAPNPLLFGGGTHGDPGIVCLNEGTVWTASAASLCLSGHSLPHVATAHSCRLLEPPLAITQCRGSFVETIGGEPALDVLKRAGASLDGQPLLLTVLAKEAPELAGGYEFLVRGIQGIDPDRRALLLSQDVEPGTLIAFAARDADAARAEMQLTCRRLAHDTRGTVGRFGLFFNCSGRGLSLYSQPDTDMRMIRERFPALPIAGFQSAFEIGPFDGAPALQLYTGILAIFGATS